MDQVFPSEIELYFCANVSGNEAIITGEEAHHILNVMRHKVDDQIYLTDGCGSIYTSVIKSLTRKEIVADIISKQKFDSELSNFTICIPRIKNSERFEFALEKCIELGFTNFVIFESERTVSKGEKLERWNKISLAAMKQSLRCYLPRIEFLNAFRKISELEGNKILFDQNASETIQSYLHSMKSTENYILIFGPEGGLTESELDQFENSVKLKLTDNRLRTETAIVAAASIISLSN